MPIELMMPLSMTMGFVAFTLIARWYVMPRLNGMSRAQALKPLLLLHSFRYIGLAFLIPGVTASALDPRFAEPAAYGDLAAAVLALVAILALHRGWSVAIPLVWLFSVAGALDLVNAVAKGLLFTQEGEMGATYFIPAMIVPALLVSHAMVFRLLVRNGRKIRRTDA